MKIKLDLYHAFLFHNNEKLLTLKYKNYLGDGKWTLP